MTQTTEPRQKVKLSIGVITRETANVFFSIAPIVGGIAFLTISSAAIPVALSVTAISLGTYHSVITVQGWCKPQVPKPPSGSSAISKVREWLNNPNKRKSFKMKALIASAMGAVKWGMGMNLASTASGLAVAASFLSVYGGITAVGGIVVFAAFSFLTSPRYLNKVNKLLDKLSAAAPSPAARTSSPDFQPASKLDNAAAKTGFNAAAGLAAKPATNDNAAQPKNNISQPKSPAA